MELKENSFFILRCPSQWFLLGFGFFGLNIFLRISRDEFWGQVIRMNTARNCPHQINIQKDLKLYIYNFKT